MEIDESGFAGADVESARPASLEVWAERKPNEAAIIEGGKTTTWQQWNDGANRLAEGLAQRGIGPGDVVACRLQIRAEWAIVNAAVAKLEARLLLVNYHLTPHEVGHVLENSGAVVLICDDQEPEALVPMLEQSEVTLAISVEIDNPRFERFDSVLASGAPARRARGEAALIVYTSGTTGSPKGLVSPSGFGATPDVLEYRQSLATHRPPTAEPVILVTMPLHHAAGPVAVRAGARTGTPMVFLRRFDPTAALRAIERYRITDWSAVPTMFKRIAALPEDTLRAIDVSSIKTLGIGTAPVPPALKSWIRSYFGDCIYENYGLTETGLLTGSSPALDREKPGTNGRPFRHVTLEVRDVTGITLAPNEVGELWARSPVTNPSYLNSAEVIVDERGFLKTGDVGRLDEDGCLFITDRVKDLIISGGVNIYPTEIEAVLLTHPAIQDVAVIGVPDDDFGERVKAVCELRPGSAIDLDEVRSFCAERLASYKRPKSIDVVDELPRNNVGKILKRELRMPYWAGKRSTI